MRVKNLLMGASVVACIGVANTSAVGQINAVKGSIVNYCKNVTFHTMSADFSEKGAQCENCVKIFPDDIPPGKIDYEFTRNNLGKFKASFRLANDDRSLDCGEFAAEDSDFKLKKNITRHQGLVCLADVKEEPKGTFLMDISISGCAPDQR